MAAEKEKKAGAAKPAAAKKDRPALKARLAKLKKAREVAKEAKESEKLALIRRDYRRTTHALRRTAAPKAKKAKKE